MLDKRHPQNMPAAFAPALSPQEKAQLVSLALRQMLALFDSIQKIDPTVEAHFISQQRASRSYTFTGEVWNG